jgi:hypothetical protein
VIASEAAAHQQDDVHAWTRELEAARYAARRAQKQYDANDPDNRLVAEELERRWNQALQRVREISFEDRFGLLVDTEWTAREHRRLTQRLRQAKLRYPGCAPQIIIHGGSGPLSGATRTEAERRARPAGIIDRNG